MEKGLNPKEFGRGAGVLLPISSLPSPYGIGTLGREAEKFIDALENAGQRYWQVLPVGPTSYGDSPYQSFSAFAGNPYFIDLEELIEEGLLERKEVMDADFGDTPEYVQYDKMFEARFPLLKVAYKKSGHESEADYKRFEKEEAFWLEDYALFMALKEHFNQVSWLEWEEDIRFRKEGAVLKYREELKETIGFYKFLQYRFYQAWNRVKTYANGKEIEIIGDIPIYVALDSADVWANPQLFQLDEDLRPINVAGCPPDAFSEDGQKWGNPLYDWKKMESDGFAWWKKRMKASAQLYDVIRIDHFIGMVRYYNIPFNESPKEGWYEKGPGIKLVKAIESVIGESRIIAEDLGVVVPEVVELLKESGYPGMKVLEFAFDGGSQNVYLPHNHEKNYILYIGTHDNDTIRGYYKELSEESKEYLKTYLGIEKDDEKCVVDTLIRSAYQSVCDTVILQMQDILYKDESARMNIPSTLGMNWKWRMLPSDFDEECQEKLLKLADVYARHEVEEAEDETEEEEEDQ